MDLIKEYTQKSTFKNDADFYESLTQIFKLGTIKSDFKTLDILHSKEAFNSLTIKFLESILSAELATTIQEKVAIINLLDELNFRNEIIHLIANKDFEGKLEETSKRLGKKFMSSVKE